MKLELVELYELVKENTNRFVCGDCKTPLKFVSIDQYVSIWVMVTVRCNPCDAEVAVKMQIQPY